MQRLEVNNKTIYLCEALDTEEQILLYEESNGELGQIEDKAIKEQVEKLIYVESPDIIFKKGSIKNGKIF